MQNISLEKLRKKGYRITQTRKKILDILKDSKEPISAALVLNELKQAGIQAHKTTVYRTLDTMAGEDIVREIYFADGITYYELARQKHHHHLVCIKCKSVEDIHTSYPMTKTEKAINKNTGFVVLHHSLEFFGLCSKCK